VKLSFAESSKLCNTLLQGNLSSFATGADILQFAMLRNSQSLSESPESFWLSNGNNDTEYRSFNTSTDKKEGIDQDCLLCDDNECQYEDCQALHPFFCSFTEQPIAKLRGLCPLAELSIVYYPSMKLGSFSWLSIDGSYIIYNTSSQMWNIAVAESTIKAEAYASYGSLLIGNKLWRIWNSFSCFSGKAKDVRISLSLCQEDYFNCDDGGCVPLNSKCDGMNDCQDGSDELKCKIIQIPSNYNKQLTPVCFSDSFGFVNITFEIIDILSVDEKMGKMRLKFRLAAAWKDCRLQFFDLWYWTAMNTLDHEEMDAIWQPVINFDNADLDQFHYNQKPEVSVVFNRSTIWTRATPNQLYNAYVYPASFNSFLLISKIR
jgi:hypothetical protein